MASFSARGLRVFKVFIEALDENPETELCGSDIQRSVSILSGTLYPLLNRFEEQKYLKSRWEKIDPKKEGRPRRRFYRLTPLGEAVAREAVTEFERGWFSRRTVTAKVAQ